MSVRRPPKGAGSSEAPHRSTRLYAWRQVLGSEIQAVPCHRLSPPGTSRPPRARVTASGRRMPRLVRARLSLHFDDLPVAGAASVPAGSAVSPPRRARLRGLRLRRVTKTRPRYSVATIASVGNVGTIPTALFHQIQRAAVKFADSLPASRYPHPYANRFGDGRRRGLGGYFDARNRCNEDLSRSSPRASVELANQSLASDIFIDFPSRPHLALFPRTSSALVGDA